jgi:hypothetical protein
MSKTSITVIGLVFAVAGWAAFALAGGTPLENEGVNKGNQAAAAASENDAAQSGDEASYNSDAIADHDAFELLGTVVHKDLEGGFFAIDGDDGRTYDPINLPETFKKEGLKVKVIARLRKDVGSIHMIGDIIEIVDIAAQ